jgi:hypothetical protein
MLYTTIYICISKTRKKRKAGFGVTDRGCCGVGRNRSLITCLPMIMPW